MEAIIQGVRSLISDPTSNLTAAAIGLAMLVLISMIFVVALLALAMPGARSRRSKARASRGGPRRRKRKDVPSTPSGASESPIGPTPAPRPLPQGTAPRPAPQGVAPRPAPRGVAPRPIPQGAGPRPDGSGTGEGARSVAQSRAEGDTIVLDTEAQNDSASASAGAAKRDRRASDAAPGRKRSAKAIRRRRRAMMVFGLIASGLFVGSLATAYVGTSVNSYCTSLCHAMANPATSWKSSNHKSVACVRCHEGRYAVTAPAAMVSRGRSIYLALSQSDVEPAPINAARCLECHAEILERTVVGPDAVAMSHVEVIEAGSDCGDCHGRQGHQPEALSAYMDICLRCHDGKKAPNKCTYCHPKGAEASISKPIESFGSPVQLPERVECGGCHAQTRCDACHGVRMPHPADFKKPQQHAMLGAFERKEAVCGKCHSPQDCSQCHQSFDAHSSEPGAWRKDHQKYVWNTGYCNWCHETRAFCSVCHTSRPAGSRIDSTTLEP